MPPKIDAEFSKLLPPLSLDELAELEASILDEGVRDPLIVWRGVLLDGSNRLAIATKHGLPYREQEIDLPDRDAALAWIIRNQLGRRNLSGEQRQYLLGRDALRTPRDKGGRPSDNSSNSLTSLQALADEHGVTRQTLDNAAEYAKAVDALEDLSPGFRAEALAPEAAPAQKDVTRLAEVARRDPDTAKAVIERTREIEAKPSKGQPRKTKLKAVLREVEKEQAPPVIIPEGRFSVIYADPPWEYRNDGLAGAASEHYSTMSTEDLCALPVVARAAANAVLFLWVTNPLLVDGLAVLSAWGFSYKTNAVWVKDEATYGKLGFYLRGCHELLLIGVRGSMLPEEDRRPSSVLQVPKREHSRKPDEAYELIESVYPDAVRLELFARTTREGWTQFGEEAGKWT